MDKSFQFTINWLNNLGDGSNRARILSDPGNYALYIIRKKHLLNLKDYEENRKEEYLPVELEFTKEIIRANIKNYQVWNHLRFLNKEFGVPFLDNEFFMEIFQIDTRNCYLFDYLNWHIVNFKNTAEMKELVSLMFVTESANNSVKVLENTLNVVKN